MPEFVDYFVMAIALLTDFGESDYFAGAMKGVILSINPSASIIDITHSIARHDVQSAAFCLMACYRDYPSGTVFLSVVDPGVGSERREIAVSSELKFFVAPDNGLLTHVLMADPAAIVVELENPRYFGANVSSTFQGRDVFAPVSAHISKGIEFSDLGPPVRDPVLLEFEKYEQTNEQKVFGSVIHIDGFGNLVTNIPSVESERIKAIEIAGRKIDRHLKYYQEARPGELFFIAGSAGFIEICIYSESAADYLHSLVSDPLAVHLKTPCQTQ